MWTRRFKSELPDPEQALPGRTEPMRISGVHHVNGSSMVPPFPDDTETLVVGMGCFWGAERFFWQIPGVVTTAAGYAGGSTPNPTYEETCTGRTGHTEAVLIVYRPEEVDIDSLLKVFWENHDPTTPNRQGNDVGTQYRSAIYTTTDEQYEAAVASRDRYQKALDDAGFGTISTEIKPAETFYYAEEYHQQYLAKNPNGYCNHGFCQVSYS
jgi:peptide-methionine (S)-S-oxide reductase